MREMREMGRKLMIVPSLMMPTKMTATFHAQRGLTSADKVAEALDHDDGDVEEDTGHDKAEEPIGKRRRRPNTRYQNFWRHREGPGIDSEDEEYE
jgi:hypothetical protein